MTALIWITATAFNVYLFVTVGGAMILAVAVFCGLMALYSAAIER